MSSLLCTVALLFGFIPTLWDTTHLNSLVWWKVIHLQWNHLLIKILLVSLDFNLKPLNINRYYSKINPLELTILW